MRRACDGQHQPTSYVAGYQFERGRCGDVVARRRIDRYEQRRTELATRNSATPVDAAEMSSVQFHRVQVSRTRMAGQRARHVPAARRPLRQLLAALLLVRKGDFV